MSLMCLPSCISSLGDSGGGWGGEGRDSPILFWRLPVASGSLARQDPVHSSVIYLHHLPKTDPWTFYVWFPVML